MTNDHIPLNGDGVLNAVTSALHTRPSTARVLSSALEGTATEPETSPSQETETPPSGKRPATDPSQGRAPARPRRPRQDPILEAFMGLRSFN